jgi:hypothetical protein
MSDKNSEQTSRKKSSKDNLSIFRLMSGKEERVKGRKKENLFITSISFIEFSFSAQHLILLLYIEKQPFSAHHNTAS